MYASDYPCVRCAKILIRPNAKPTLAGIVTQWTARKQEELASKRKPRQAQKLFRRAGFAMHIVE
jgi:hypothetical protein